MNSNASIYDSLIYGNIFSSQGMRAIWSDQARIQHFLDFERALAEAQAVLGIVPKNAADEIGRYCRVEEMDFDKLRQATEHIGYPVLPVVQQLVALCKDGLGQWAH